MASGSEGDGSAADPTVVGMSRPVAAVVAVLAVGVGLGLVWRLAAASAAEASDFGERQVAGDGSFFVLAAVLGVLTAVALHRRPGPNPALRLALVLAGSLVASAVAVGVSVVLGGPALFAWGGLLVWPWSTAMLTALAVAVRMLLPGDEDGAARPVRSS